MENELLSLVPTRFLCPHCGEWHTWEEDNLEFYDSFEDQAALACSHFSYRKFGCNYNIYIDNGYLHYSAKKICPRASLELEGKVKISSIIESPDKPIATFQVPLKSKLDMDMCLGCPKFFYCNLVKAARTGNHQNIEVTLGFEFEQPEYNNIVKPILFERREKNLQTQEKDLATRETAVTQREADLSAWEAAVTQREAELSAREAALADTLAQREAELTTAKATTNKEDKKMKFDSLAAQLYEHSPKENVELVKAWATKYQPVLQWAIPVATIYGAYRILNSSECDLSVNNISETFEKTLGFKLEILDNKRALKELLALGGVCSSAYAAMNVISGVFGTNSEDKDISVKDVEAGMNQLESASKRFPSLQAMAEHLLPIACSVILVYVTLHKPKFSSKITKKFADLTEDFRIKLAPYIRLAKDFIQSKFQIDLSNEEEQRKFKICAFLVAVMGIFAFLYGKKVLGDKSTPKEDTSPKKEELQKSAEAFIQQAKAIMEKIAPTVYTTLISILVSKKLLMLEEHQEVIPASAPVEENSPEHTGTNPSTVPVDAET